MKKYYWLFSITTATLCSNPTSPQVISGEASFESSRAKTLAVTATDKAILHWEDFSISPDEIVHFQLPDIRGASVLNRVTGALPSRLDGGLTSNGHIYLINPEGIILGKSGYVHAAGFTASTLDVVNEDFLKGEDLLFQATGRPPSSRRALFRHGTGMSI